MFDPCRALEVVAEASIGAESVGNPTNVLVALVLLAVAQLGSMAIQWIRGSGGPGVRTALKNGFAAEANMRDLRRQVDALESAAQERRLTTLQKEVDAIRAVVDGELAQHIEAHAKNHDELTEKLRDIENRFTHLLYRLGDAATHNVNKGC